jgi:hypothetical protein
MRIAILDLTAGFSWDNGHATSWRARIAALGDRGQRVVLCERDVPYYASQRDRIWLDSHELVPLFPAGRARYRVAPRHDFHPPPHAGLLQHQRWWPGELDWETWHRAVAPALAPPSEVVS